MRKSTTITIILTLFFCKTIYSQSPSPVVKDTIVFIYLKNCANNIDVYPSYPRSEKNAKDFCFTEITKDLWEQNKSRFFLSVDTIKTLKTFNINFTTQRVLTINQFMEGVKKELSQFLSLSRHYIILFSDFSGVLKAYPLIISQSMFWGD
jgi:hypothetical protein